MMGRSLYWRLIGWILVTCGIVGFLGDLKSTNTTSGGPQGPQSTHVHSSLPPHGAAPDDLPPHVAEPHVAKPHIAAPHVVAHHVPSLHGQSPHGAAPDDAATKLLFLGYRRGGSSIGSEIFDMDPSALMWYEPLDAFYFSQTGYHGRKDQRVILYDNETDFRPVEPWEHAKMSEFFHQLLACDLARVPPEFMMHRFIKHSSALGGYYTCYQRATQGSITDDLDHCRDQLAAVCGRSVETALQNKCRQLMTAVHNIRASQKLVSSSMARRLYHELTVTQGVGHQVADGLVQAGVAYSQCLNKLDKIVGQCLPEAVRLCKAKKLRVIKLVRVTMDVLESVMKTVPNLRLIVFVRDPRAMAYSRSDKHKTVYSLQQNSLRACRKMARDNEVTRRLARRFPEAVLVVRYEDFVANPEYWSRQLYRHVGHTPPKDLDAFIRSHMFASEDDGKKWGNIRTNATELATRWHAKLDKRTVQSMQAICGHDLITELGYQLET